MDRYASPYVVERPEPILRAEVLYSGDNGRIHCGDVRCAGQSAAYTGRTIGGLRVEAIDVTFVRAWTASIGAPPACERCGRVATEIAALGGVAATRMP